ncbi:MAG: PD-(D/E)XK nuclease family protein [Dehalococcoidia bacterium]|nr:PD-(D/E)XK nuclease family protein [Dehalococcoidia bacterium]
MSVELHFLGWDAPASVKVREFLLPRQEAGPFDLGTDLVVVPTNQAGRRLREALALHCSSRKTALLSLRVVTPSFFLRPENDAANLASPLEAAAVWADVLMRADLGRYSGLFPARVPSQDFRWALRTGEMIEGLRRTLADGGYRIADVYRQFGGILEEKERWHNLAELETAYLERLGEVGLHDPKVRELQSAESSEPPAGAERIVLAAVPDPTPLVVRKLERLADRIPIAVLVHAPESLADCFDGWGRPLPAKWRERYIDIPDPDDNILLSGPPWSQSQKVLELMAQEAGRFGPADVALGVPDDEVVPFLEADLASAGLVPFNPAGKAAARHPIAQLLQAFLDVNTEGDYRSVSALLRNSDFLDYLQKKHRIPPGRVLEELDRCQNEHLPQSLDDLVRAVRGRMWKAARRTKFPGLAKAVGVITDQVRAFETAGMEPTLRSFLQAVYESRILSARKPGDSEFAAVAEATDTALRRLAQGPLAELGLDKRNALELLLWSLGRESYYPEPDDAIIDLEGWLELPWNDARFLIVTGMNDGKVPDSRPADVFLPDTLRRQLNLRHDGHRLARDAYLMAVLIESRRKDGRVCFIVGKTGASGDVLKPSRLLFRCRDAELPRRAAQLFGPPPETRVGHPSSVSFRLEAVPPPDVPLENLDLKKISVTDFRDYLDCPFRYYLKHVLGMEALDDDKTELDAMDFGSLVHDALHQTALNEEMRQCEDVDRLREFLADKAVEWVKRRFGRKPTLQVEVQLEAARQRLSQAARIQARLVREGWDIVHAEMQIEGEMEGVQIRGKIDRIDRHRQTGRIRLLDYKTTDRGGTPEAAHFGSLSSDGEWPDYARIDIAGKRRRWIDLQLPLYAILLPSKAELEGPFELGYFNLPKALEDTGVVLWVDPSPALLESARTCAAGVIADIKNRRFWPPARKTRYDDFASLLPTDPILCVNAEGFQAFLDEGKTA